MLSPDFATEVKRRTLLVVIAAASAACGDSATDPRTPIWTDYAGEWRLQADAASGSFHNCRNLNTAEGGIRIRLDPEGTFAAATGTHNGGWGGSEFGGTVSGSLTPPVDGMLVLTRPGGSGLLTLRSVAPDRMTGSFFSTDTSFADPASGRTPCAFDAVVVRP
jgi:hypothetical protein